MAITAFYDRIDKYIVRARLRQPLHVGSAGQGNAEILLHPVSDMPFVQASGIAGVFRACYEEFFGSQAQAMDLFGDNDKKAGRIRFTDGSICEAEKGIHIELRPRLRINPVTGTSASAKGKGADDISGQKFEMEYIGAGLEMEFRVYIFSEQGSAQAEPVEKQRIEQVFAQIHNGQVQFGGQKSNGCGAMEILTLRHHAFNLCDEQGRKDWAGEDKEDSILYEEMVPALEKISEENLYSARAYTITLDARTEGSVLVKAIALSDAEIRAYAERGEKEPDYVNMRNAGGQYIIPGSSVKGAVRAQFERIAGYLTENMQGFDGIGLIEDAFGRTGTKNNTGAAGNVRFYDVVVGKIDGHAQEVISNRIHIDRFTGGVMNTGLFKEQAVHGKLRIEAAVMNRTGDGGRAGADRSCAMLLLALRDLALGMYNLGSGYSVGRGFLCADSLSVRRSDGAKAVVAFTPAAENGGSIGMSVDDPKGILEQCMQALYTASGRSGAETAGKENA